MIIKKSLTQKKNSFFSRSFFKTKKAQLEIVGLVFIVIIVSVAMLFYLNYSVNNKDDKGLLKEYSDNELGTSFALTFLKLSMCGVEVDDLLVDCAFQKQIICSQGRSSCEMINDTLLYLLNETLDAWDESYGISIRYTQMPSVEDTDNPKETNWIINGPSMMSFEKEKWTYVRYNCTEETTGKRAPGIFLIPISGTGDSVSLEVGMCN